MNYYFMDPMCLGWVMGVIDGEGSILLTKSGGTRNPRIMLPSTDIEVLEELKRLVGGYICKRADKREYTFQAWTWVLSSSATLNLLKSGVYLLRVPLKRARANYLLEHWKPGMTREIRSNICDGFFKLPDLRHKRSEL
jgi:hypothetical protein